MAQETLPNPGVGAAIDKYNSERRKVVGKSLLVSGGKALAVGAFAVGAVLASVVGLTVSAPAGIWMAGGLALYGAVKLGEGAINRMRG